ncbi:MAG TPA: hypothetical protein VFD35_11310 [Pricia sp.]|nr:hypothetical protein [Pricia sp.]
MEERDLYVLILIGIVLAVIIALFVLLRGFVLWYYKIDKRIKLMEENKELLKKVLENKI